MDIKTSEYYRLKMVEAVYRNNYYETREFKKLKERAEMLEAVKKENNRK